MHGLNEYIDELISLVKKDKPSRHYFQKITTGWLYMKSQHYHYQLF